MFLFFWTILGMISGACIAVQAPINARLAAGLGMPVAAAAVSFGAGALALVALTLFLSRTQAIPLQWSAPAPWLFVAGGLLGAFYVTMTVVLTPKIGAAAVMALAVAGQLLAGLTLDKIGFLGLATRELSLGRVGGAVLLVAGVLMIRFL